MIDKYQAEEKIKTDMVGMAEKSQTVANKKDREYSALLCDKDLLISRMEEEMDSKKIELENLEKSISVCKEETERFRLAYEQSEKDKAKVSLELKEAESRAIQSDLEKQVSKPLDPIRFIENAIRKASKQPEEQ